MAVEIVDDKPMRCTRLWVTEPVMVTVLNRGEDWDVVRERVKMFSVPLNTTSGCPRFVSCILGLPVVRYMSHQSGGLFATEGGTALRVELKQEHLPNELDELAGKHNLFGSQQSAKMPLTVPELTGKVVDALVKTVPAVGLLDGISRDLSKMYGFRVTIGIDAMGVVLVESSRRMTNEQIGYAKEYATLRLQ